MPKIKISSSQMRNLVFLQYIGSSVVILPSLLVDIAHQNAWITVILGSILSVFVVFIYNALSNQMKHRTLLEYIEDVFGNYIGKFISILFFIFFIIASSTQIWIVGNFLNTHIMHETPQYIINLLFMIVIVIASKLGIEVVARTSEIALPLIILGFFISIIGLADQIDIKNMLPFLEDGIKPVTNGILPFLSITSFTFIALFIFYPSSIDDTKKGNKSFLTGTIISSINLFIIVSLSILVLGPEVTGRHFYPTHVLAKKIKIGEFLQRVEGIISMIWLLTVFYKSFIYFNAVVLSTLNIFKIKNYKSFIIPIAMIIVILSTIVYPSTIYAREWDRVNWVILTLIFGFIFPIILLILGKIRGK